MTFQKLVFSERLLRSSAFRLALGYAALFTSSTFVLLAFLYWSTAAYMSRQADETIEAEIVGLAERYRLTGLNGLTASIRERLDRRPQGSSIYLLTDPLGSPLVGNLSRWPPVDPGDDGFLEFELASAPGEAPHRARAKPFLLRGGFQLLVGRDLHELSSARSLLLGAMGWGLALTVALALAGGVVVGRSRLRRIGAIGDVLGQVMEGDLSKRIPAEERGDDIEDLVTKVNVMLDELEKLVEGVRRVSDSIAHDLRTPLARLKTRLEKLRRRQPEGEDGEVEEAIAEADRLLATFSALLRIARLESGEKARGSFEDVDLTALVDDVAELYGPAIDERGRKLVLHNAPGVVVRADRDMLFQAVSNLVDNALKHASDDGRIELALAPHERGAAIVVADDGPGIPEGERGNVRERFYRLDRSRSTPGAGLGLSLVQAVAELHRGELRLEDNHPGLRAVLVLPSE
jgi:signal transduction histidine kinase